VTVCVSTRKNTRVNSIFIPFAHANDVSRRRSGRRGSNSALGFTVVVAAAAELRD